MPQLDKYGRDKSSLLSKPSKYQSAMDRDINFENTPYTMPTQISKGTLATNLGGIFEIKDATGGTTLLTADPYTGVVTVAGSLVANIGVNLGTVANAHITGTTTLQGTISNVAINSGGTYNNGVFGTPNIVGADISSSAYNAGVIGTPQITGGTVNASVYQSAGTAGISGTAIYVKNLVPGDLGTLIFSRGLLVSST